jgi:hypothetical protein
MRNSGTLTVLVRLVACAGMMLVWQAVPVHADAIADCNQGRNLDLRMRRCTGVMSFTASTPEQKSVAYRHRGLARANAGTHAKPSLISARRSSSMARVQAIDEAWDG